MAGGGVGSTPTMIRSPSNPRFAPPITSPSFPLAAVLLVIFSLSATNTPISTIVGVQAAQALNITAVLSAFPQLSSFSSLLSSTAVSADLSSRSPLTLLAIPNSRLLPPAVASAAASTPLADVLRYHVLLRYLTWHDLRQIPPSGTLIPTLYQTTGRAADNFGSLNLTFDPSNGIVSLQPPTSPSVFRIPNFINPAANNSNSSNPPNSATVLTLVRSFSYNLSIFTVSSLIAPYSSDLVASETRPPSPGLNITKALIDGHGFNVAASMLAASGVVDEFEADEAGAGITLFVPTDEAFANLPPSVQLQGLPANQKAVVLKFHVLHSYYPLGSLESIVNPMQPTLATEDSGAGSFTLNISRVNGSLALNSGVVQAVVTQTVFDQNPVAIFGVSHVLLPKEMFGDGRDRSVNLGARNGSDGVLAPPPDDGADSPSGVYSPLSHQSSPPGLRDEVGSVAAAAAERILRRVVVICTGSFLLYLLFLVL